VLALDFPGHGHSPRSFGGSYTPENLVANADVALAHVGETQLLGAGLGAYVALLLAGARPDRIRGALLLPGPGLAGGGPEPNRAEPEGMSQARFGALLVGISADADPDPMLENCDRDIRPPDYARAHADAARLLLLAEDDVERPPWWQAARDADCAAVVPADPKAALARLAAS
jgi:pimeloyl-ACP methyl ester carboxylesterase